MAGVFKSLDKADIRITPFRTYKLWSDTIGSGGSGSIYSIYQADYNPISNHPDKDPLKDSFDQGNPILQANEPTTINGKYQRIVHASIDRIYYKYYLTNNKASYGGGNIETQFRLLEDKAQVISMPQSKFGQQILPGSVMISVSWSFAASSGSYTTSSVANRSGSWTIVDDELGNLKVSGSNYLSVYGQYVGGAYTNYSSSVEKATVGEWPLDELYKYADIGTTTFTTNTNRGVWPMNTTYNNVAISTTTGSTAPQTSDIDLLGAKIHFTASNSSSLVITSTGTPNYNKYYSFENGNYTISMMVLPTQKPTHASGSILLTKEGPGNQLQLDLNGNTFTQTTPNKFPYRLSYTTGSNKVLFEISGGGHGSFALTSSISMSINTLYHVVATKTGSLVSLYVNSLTTSSIDTGTTTILDKHTSNLSSLIVGNAITNTQGFNGTIDNLKMYNSIVSTNDIKILHHTLGVGNIYLGNAFYSHGMMVLGAIPARTLTINKVESRGTHTVWENEISCTTNPGEFNLSYNRTLQEYDPLQNQFVFRSFIQSPDFRPYITTIGLYNDAGELLLVGKLNTAIQLPTNMDTTFIVRYDR